MATEETSRDLSAWIWLWLPPALAVALLVTRWLDPAAHERWLAVDEGPVEWLTVLVLLPAVWAGWGAWRRRRLLPERSLGVWVLLATAGALYFAGEELSWGRQLVRGEPPEAVRQVDQGHGTDLREADGPRDTTLRLALELFVLVGGIVVPLLGLRNGGDEARATPWRDWFWPGLVCVPTAVLAILVRLPDRLDQLGLELHEGFFGGLRPSEAQEYYFAYFLMVYLLSIRTRLVALERAS